LDRIGGIEMIAHQSSKYFDKEREEDVRIDLRPAAWPRLTCALQHAKVFSSEPPRSSRVNTCTIFICEYLH